SILRERLAESALPLDIFLQRLTHRPYHRVPGTAVYMTGNGAVVPYAFLHNLKHNKVLHERIVLLTVTIADVPRVAQADRATIEHLATGFIRITMRFGFIDTPDVPRALAACAGQGLTFDMMDTSFFVGRETLVPSIRARMWRWREALFLLLARNAVSATDFFLIPSNRVVELGAQVAI
ncbi:MAG: KUP/HAK/KT family potassium transporter, partial [Alphaproteobacteria bacterium]